MTPLVQFSVGFGTIRYPGLRHLRPVFFFFLFATTDTATNKKLCLSISALLLHCTGASPNMAQYQFSFVRDIQGSRCAMMHIMSIAGSCTEILHGNSVRDGMTADSPSLKDSHLSRVSGVSLSLPQPTPHSDHKPGNAKSLALALVLWCTTERDPQSTG